MRHRFKIGQTLISVKYGCIVEVTEIDPDGEKGYRIKVIDYANYSYTKSLNNHHILRIHDEDEFVLLTDQTKILYGVDDD